MTAIGRSPLVSQRTLARHARDESTAPHTKAELDTVVHLVRALRAELITIGCGRDTASVSAARSFADIWRTSGRRVLRTVDWPRTAASWLKFAQQLTDGAPDAWVVADSPEGWAQMARRLRHSTGWEPSRTVAFGSLGRERLIDLAGARTIEGMTGATSAGGGWRVSGNAFARVEVEPDEGHGL